MYVTTLTKTTRIKKQNQKILENQFKEKNKHSNDTQNINWGWESLEIRIKRDKDCVIKNNFKNHIRLWPQNTISEQFILQNEENNFRCKQNPTLG